MKLRFFMMKCYFLVELIVLLLDGCCIYYEFIGRIVESKLKWLKCWLLNKFFKKVLDFMEWIILVVVRIILVLYSILKMVKIN